MTHTVQMDKIVHALENGEYVIGLYIDFSKAFDTVIMLFYWIDWNIMEFVEMLFPGSKVIWQTDVDL